MLIFPDLMYLYCFIPFFFLLSFIDPRIKAFCLFKKGGWTKTRQYLVWDTWSIATSLQCLTCPSFIWASKDVSWTYPSTFFRYLYLFDLQIYPLHFYTNARLLPFWLLPARLLPVLFINLAWPGFILVLVKSDLGIQYIFPRGIHTKYRNPFWGFSATYVTLG